MALVLGTSDLRFSAFNMILGYPEGQKIIPIEVAGIQAPKPRFGAANYFQFEVACLIVMEPNCYGTNSKCD